MNRGAPHLRHAPVPGDIDAARRAARGCVDGGADGPPRGPIRAMRAALLAAAALAPSLLPAPALAQPPAAAQPFQPSRPAPAELQAPPPPAAPASAAPAAPVLATPASSASPPSVPVSGSGPVPAVNAATGYSAAALYDLGNAYVRAGKSGLAALSYERARLLDPDDPDLEANLSHVRAAAGLPEESRSRFERYGSSVDAPSFYGIGVVGVLIVGAATLARRRYRHRRAALSWLQVLGVAGIAAAAANAAALWPVMHRAVVIVHAAPVHVSPVSIGDPEFTIPEAENVRVRAERAGYALVETPDGHLGWVAADQIAAVVPRRAH